MNTDEISNTLTTLFSELVDGAPQAGAYMLNHGDPRLLVSLDRLSSAAASAAPPGGASIAAHVEHLRYGLSLMNRWAAGENPFADADWAASWRRTTVTDAEWEQLRAGLREEAHRWLEALRTPREVDPVELNGVIGSIAHLAYHLGAIRRSTGRRVVPRRTTRVWVQIQRGSLRDTCVSSASGTVYYPLGHRWMLARASSLGEGPTMQPR